MRAQGTCAAWGGALRGAWGAARHWVGSALGWALAPGPSWVHARVEEGRQPTRGAEIWFGYPLPTLGGERRHPGAVP